MPSAHTPPLIRWISVAPWEGAEGHSTATNPGESDRDFPSPKGLKAGRSLLGPFVGRSSDLNVPMLVPQSPLWGLVSGRF